MSTLLPKAEFASRLRQMTERGDLARSRQCVLVVSIDDIAALKRSPGGKAAEERSQLWQQPCFARRRAPRCPCFTRQISLAVMASISLPYSSVRMSTGKVPQWSRSRYWMVCLAAARPVTVHDLV